MGVNIGVLEELMAEYLIFLCKKSRERCKEINKKGLLRNKRFYLLDESNDFCFCRFKKGHHDVLYINRKINKEDAALISVISRSIQVREELKNSKTIERILKSYKRPEISRGDVEKKLPFEILKDFPEIELEGNDFILFYTKGGDLLVLVYDKSIFEELRKRGEEYSRIFLS